MAYPQLRTGGSKTYTAQLFNTTNSAIDYPSGTTFSANTSDFNIATATVSSDGKTVTVTPEGSVTGNVFVTLTTSIPNFAGDITGTILIHIMDSPLSEAEFIQLTPVI
jgi:hypothetical protein